MKRFLSSPRVLARRPGAMLTAVALLAGGTAFAIIGPGAPATQQHAGATAATMSPHLKAMLDALRTAITSKQQVTVDALTTETSQTVANPDGTLTRTDYVDPVRVRRSGTWQPVSADLQPGSSGTWQPRAVPSGVTLSGGGSGPLAVLTSVTGQKLTLGFPARLPKPVIAGATATYASVWPGTDLRVSVDTLGGLTWTVIVHDAKAAANPALRQLKLGVTTAGLTVGSDPAGNLRAVGQRGAAGFSGSAAAVWDSAGGGHQHAGQFASTPGGPGRAARTARVAARVSRNALSLAPDASLLTGTTSYPVYLASSIAPDATVAVPGTMLTSVVSRARTGAAAAATASPSPEPSNVSCDTVNDYNEACSGATNGFAEVQAGCPTATNYDVTQNPGSYPGNGIGYNWWDSCTGPYRSYYQFDTSDLTSILTSGDIANGVKLWVQDATLFAWVRYGADWTCSDTWPVHLDLTGPISSSTDWNNKPGNDPSDNQQSTTTPSGPNPNSSCPERTLGFNVAYAMTKAVTSQPPLTNLTFKLSGDETASSSSSNIGFMRIGNNPDIVTRFDINPPAPTGQTTSPTPHYEPGGPINNGCNQPTSNLPWLGNPGTYTDSSGHTVSDLFLSATIKANITGEPVRAYYTLKDVTTGTTLISPSVNTVTSGWYTTSGTTGTHPDLMLTDGNTYTWTTQAFVSGIPVGSTPGYWSKPAAPVCGFNYDGAAPTVPSVTSSDFPAPGSGTNPTLDAGSSGTFTFTSSDPVPVPACAGCQASGVYEFVYSLNGDLPPTSQQSPPTSANCNAISGAVLASSGTASCTITVGDWGTNILSVWAVDKAGNRSNPSRYYFYVPWDPGRPVVPGDVNGNGIPDLLSTDSNGDLTLYKGNVDPVISPDTASVAADSPDHTSWGNYQIAHRGPVSQISASGDVDDLFAHKDGGASLYLYENEPKSTGNSPQFEDTGAIVNEQRPACPGCADYASTWRNVTKLLAPGDAWNPTPGTSASPEDTGQPSLLTVEKDPNNPNDTGTLWLYQGNYGPGLQKPVELGSSGWAGVTIIAPGLVGGRLTVWAYDDSSGNVYSYPIYIVNNQPSLSATSNAPISPTDGTVILTYPYKGTSPAVASSGSLTNSTNTENADLAYPGLYFATPPGTGNVTYPSGTSGAAMSVSAGWVAPGTPGGEIDRGGAACPNGCLWYYPGQSPASNPSPLQSAPEFVGDLYTTLIRLS